jgi:hypothetical protein
MNLLEKYVVNEEFLKRTDVYNLTIGGTGNWFNNLKHKTENEIKQMRIKGGLASKRRIENMSKDEYN